MPYVPTVWVDDVTDINAAVMNHLEQGVASGTFVADLAIPAPAGAVTNQGLFWDGAQWVKGSLETPFVAAEATPGGVLADTGAVWTKIPIATLIGAYAAEFYSLLGGGAVRATTNRVSLWTMQAIFHRQAAPETNCQLGIGVRVVGAPAPVPGAFNYNFGRISGPGANGVNASGMSILLSAPEDYELVYIANGAGNVILDFARLLTVLPLQARRRTQYPTIPI
jgi:hypothetical protein